MPIKKNKQLASLSQIIIEAGGSIGEGVFRLIIDPKLSPASLLMLMLLANILFLVGAIACFFLYPDIVLSNEAFSTYGTIARTFVPYSLALAGTAIATSLVAMQLSRSRKRFLQEAAPWYSFLALIIIGVWATPFDLNATIYYIHNAIVGLMMLMMVTIIAKFTLEIERFVPKWSVFPLLLCFAAVLYGAFLSLVSLKIFSLMHQLFLGEMLTFAAFTAWSQLFVIVAFYARNK